MKQIQVILFFVFIIYSVSIYAQSSTGIMPWMGLERTNEDIASDLQQILSLGKMIDTVSFERFNLGPNSTLIINNLTDVQYPLQSSGLKTLPMVSTCCPWGRPEVIQYARQLINNPQPFIDAAVQQALLEGFDGWNIDIEPVGGTPEDAVGYANFINQFANELHKNGKTLTVCAATYDPFWNLTLLGQTNVDKIFTMSTYAGSYSGFSNALQFAVNSIPLSKLAVGVMTVDANNNPFTDPELQQRFELLKTYNIQYLGIWDAPIPSSWIPYLKQFLSNQQNYI
ncbi:hypothetical protein DICPUDRAFT_148531 [Dictyostelium purpureum]|uniref:GH18 domain-containing protein n=1 Tax=Dictyostelium purpureum TaxID=5786 RepID=F0ZBD0_DICPU|nr:uncharacterized protein DICPUDRAFT_148531 [Dictyostelium purpureum]EGC38753.1 hypothetical protein DICPUDRAFT_148531 [Dictyostelium purpureum]|eukprot:XP_003284744.1 hypothetical protein DICPUDRAFT_148531 [Dictyostelium purpureum]